MTTLRFLDRTVEYLRFIHLWMKRYVHTCDCKRWDCDHFTTRLDYGRRLFFAEARMDAIQKSIYSKETTCGAFSLGCPASEHLGPEDPRQRKIVAIDDAISNKIV